MSSDLLEKTIMDSPVGSGSALVPTGKTACVVGSGFGGMALAMRLQSAGIQTTVIEARDKPGGRVFEIDTLGNRMKSLNYSGNDLVALVLTPEIPRSGWWMKIWDNLFI